MTTLTMARATTRLMVALALTTLAAPAHAALVTVEFAGTLNGPIPTALASTFSSGQAFSGRYRFDTDAVARPLSDPNWVFYTYVDFSLTMGGFSASATGQAGSNQILIQDGVSGFDLYRVDSTRFTTTPTRVEGLALVRTYLQFTSARDVHGRSLPPGVPDLNDYAFNRSLQLTFGPNPNSLVDSVTMFGTVTRTGPGTSVPEPSVALLLLGAVVGAAARHRRRSA
ncbi:PEP-CTERM sorting domain-containing protein [Luteitalea sp.]